MMTENWCKECFKSVVDDTAQDRFLLMSSEKFICPSCGRLDYVVGKYFKYGEHSVDSNGHVIGVARHVGVNPNYSCWGDRHPYAE